MQEFKEEKEWRDNAIKELDDAFSNVVNKVMDSLTEIEDLKSVAHLAAIVQGFHYVLSVNLGALEHFMVSGGYHEQRDSIRATCKQMREMAMSQGQKQMAAKPDLLSFFMRS